MSQNHHLRLNTAQWHQLHAKSLGFWGYLRTESEWHQYTFFYDNKVAIYISNNPMYYE